MGNVVESWAAAMRESQLLAEREPDPEIKARHLAEVETYRRLIASETLTASMRREISDDPE